MSSSEKT